MYESFYNLTAKPFNLSPDPRFFFGSRGHKRAMSYLRYGINQGEGFIIITGDIGTGKTTLVRTLFAELSNENVVAAQLVTTQLEADDMLRMVAASYGLAHDRAPKATLLKNLEAFLMARAREGKRVLLVVDEAQNLPVRSLEELRMLSNFQVGEKALMQSFLLGQEEFRKTLQAEELEQLRQRVIASYHLSALDLEETKGYIEHRLRLVGWKQDPSFTPEAYEDIHRFSGGVPRRINMLCDRLLLYGFLEEAHEINRNTVKVVTDELLEEGSQHGVKTPPRRSEEPAPVDTSEPLQLNQPSAEQKPVAREEPPPVNRTPRVVNSDLESRVQALEASVESLRKSFRKERALLRQAILLNSSLDDD